MTALSDPITVTEKENSQQKFILVGNPNVGKSVIFNRLTGQRVNVSNYPGTTVEIATGYSTIHGKDCTVVDTPGVNSLVPMSEDEEVTRNILLDTHGAAVLQIADTKNLRRALVISSQLAELGIPFALALNMTDEATDHGVSVDAEALEEILGVPVHPTVAVRGEGVTEAASSALRATRSTLNTPLPDELENAVGKIADILPDNLPLERRGVAISILAGDDLAWIDDFLNPDIVEQIDLIRRNTNLESQGPVNYQISKARFNYVDDIVARVTHSEEKKVGVWAKRLGAWSMHPIGGLGVLAIVLILTFWFVGLLGAGTAVDSLETALFGRYISPAAIYIADIVLPFPHEHVTAENIWEFSIPITPVHNLPLFESIKDATMPEYSLADGGSLLWWQQITKLLHDVLVGPYGQFTMAISYGFAIVLPIVAFFFLVFSFMEDSGYLPRLAVMTNRVFRIMGLNGKAVLPMVLGLGCDTMATMTTRIMATQKERLIVTLLLALGVPCSAQLGVIMGMLAGAGPVGLLWWLGTVLGVMLMVGWLASKVLPGESSDLILELPSIRTPQIGNIVIKTVARVEWYLKEVVPLFMLGTGVLFVLDAIGVLSTIERLAAPLVQNWLGLPGKATEAFLIGFLRRDYGAAGLLKLHMDGLLDPIQTVVSLVTITLFVPCIANVFIIAKERNVKTAIYMVSFIFPFAFLVGGLVRYAMLAVKAIGA